MASWVSPLLFIYSDPNPNKMPPPSYGTHVAGNLVITMPITRPYLTGSAVSDMSLHPDPPSCKKVP